MAFLRDIESFHMLPAPLEVATAFYLPYLEILCGSALLLRKAVAAAAAVIFVLCLIFLAAIGQAWMRGLDVRCGCFGGGAPVVATYSWMAVRDGMLAALAMFVWRRDLRS